MISARRFTRRHPFVDVVGPLTEDNAAEVALWCGGQVHRRGDDSFCCVLAPGLRGGLELGNHLMRLRGNSYTAVTQDELSDWWVAR